MSETAASTSAGSSIEDRLLTVIESQSSVISQLLQLINGQLATIAADQKQNMATLTGTLATVLHNQEEMMSQQSDADAIEQEILTTDTAMSTAVTDLSTQLGTIQSEVAAIEAAHPEIDLSKVKAAADTQASILSSLQSADTAAQGDATSDAPAPTPAPAPDPTPSPDPAPPAS